MQRRSFLKSSALLGGLLAAPAALVACGDRGGAGGDAAAKIPEGEPSLVPIVASLELLTEGTRRVAFGLRTLENEPVEGAEAQVYLRDAASKKVLSGPFPAAVVTDAGVEGLYATEVSLDEPGTVEFVVVNDDQYGSQAMKAIPPAQSKAPVAGQKAKATATPTMDRPLGFAKVCTADPPCGMHEVSLEQALKKGQPVMLTFATPAYCQTVVCGPAVSNVEAVRKDGDFGDIAWIHVEVFSDEGQTIGEPVKSWNLPSEPWVFGIDANGTITERLDGPMVPEWLAEVANGLKTA